MVEYVNIIRTILRQLKNSLNARQKYEIAQEKSCYSDELYRKWLADKITDEKE